MFDRSDYELADFLLFSARVYYRMLEINNAALWPFHILALGLGAVLAAVLLRPSISGARLGYALLAFVWFFVAWTFFIERYATINWVAPYIAPVFMLQALMLGLMAISPKAVRLTPPTTLPCRLAIAVLLFSLVGFPLSAFASQRSWQSAEVFAIAPDPTVTATLAFLILGRGVYAAVACFIPLLWVAVSSLTLLALGSVEMVFAPLAAFVCGIALMLRRKGL